MMKKALHLLLVISRFLFVLLILGGSFVFAMFQGGMVSWTIFYAILPFALYSLLLFFYPLSNFTVQRQIESSSLQMGDSLKVKTILTRRIPFPLLYTVVYDEWANGDMQKLGQKKQELFILGWRRKLTWTYEIEQLMRGEHVAANVQIEVSDFFGWIQKRKAFSVISRVLVYPKIEAIHYEPLGVQYAGGVAMTPFKLLKDTTLVTGVRDYEEGDRMSLIHWKSFARTQTLQTKEFENRGSEDFQLILDNRRSATFEAQVSFAASILRELQQERVHVHFSPLYQVDAFQAIQAGEQFESVFTYLAKIQPVKKQETNTLSAFGKTYPHSNTIVVVTHRVDDDILQLMSELAIKCSIICFAVIEDEQLITNAIKDELKVANSKGITVKLIKNDQFTDAFKEVVSK